MRITATLSVLAATALLSSQAVAEALVTVDIRNPSAVTFTSSSALAGASGSALQQSGVTLLGFFDGNT